MSHWRRECGIVLTSVLGACVLLAVFLFLSRLMFGHNRIGTADNIAAGAAIGVGIGWLLLFLKRSHFKVAAIVIYLVVMPYFLHIFALMFVGVVFNDSL